MTAFTERQADLLAELVHCERERVFGDDEHRWGIPGIKAALGQVADRDLTRVTIAFLTAARAATNRTPAVAACDGPHWTIRSTETGSPRPEPFPQHPPGITGDRRAQLIAAARAQIKPPPPARQDTADD